MEEAGRGEMSESTDQQITSMPCDCQQPCDCERSWGWADVKAALPSMIILLFTIFIAAVVIPHVFKVNIKIKSVKILRVVISGYMEDNS